ncbi:hypothetical protein [Nonomuraea sp. NPDC049480]|uniref:hypothetical protein n=1 Tax=Nonomuraea sp. NPDC049480 TaxID=3364353 RepID=UPI0037B896B5
MHRAATRTEAVDQLLATPGPLFGDPADTLLHGLDDGGRLWATIPETVCLPLGEWL